MPGYIIGMNKQYIWHGMGTGDVERLQIRQSENQILISSQVKGTDSDLHTRWRATYSLACDTEWRVHHFRANEHLTHRHIELHGNGNGQWHDENNRELKHIAGFIDIDFRATPFSNTLPIRRLNLAIGERAVISVAYINAPDLAVSREQQIYTRLSEYSWEFNQPSANFQAVIIVDDEGFVVNYPGLFHRV